MTRALWVMVFFGWSVAGLGAQTVPIGAPTPAALPGVYLQPASAVNGAGGVTGPITSVAGVATAGSYGVPLIVATGRVTAQAAAAVSLATYTPTADASFLIEGNVLVTTATAHAFSLTCTYTDEGNTARTATLPFVNVAGAAIVTSVANAVGAVPYQGIPVSIRAKAATAITCQTTGTFTTVVYNVEVLIRRKS